MSGTKLALAVLVVCLSAAGCRQPAEDAPPPAAAAPPEPARLTAGWTVTEGVDAPESAYVDPASGSIFVSIIGGAPDARDGNGRIMKLDGAGGVVSASWAAGLNAPKGVRACGGTLWVSDITEAIGIDMATGRVSSRVALPNAQFANDVACGDDGTVYVSDSMASRIYAVQGGTATVFAEGAELEWPNGLLVHNEQLVVGAWGKPEPDFTTKVPGRLYALDLKTKAKTLITQKPFANIDGVELDGRGGYILTDWMAGKVFQVSAGGDIRELRTFPAGTADHAFVPDGNVLVLPHMSENKVAAYDMSDAVR